MTRDLAIRVLPIEGLLLNELVVEGNGKDAEVRALTSDGRRFAFGTSGSRLKIAVQGAVLTEVTGPDDATLKVRYTADRLVLRTARIRYPGSAEEWEEDVNALSRGGPMSWAIQDGSFILVGEESA